jgi:hypothetical protein
MTSFKDKSLLFYSIHPNDEHSRDFLKELEKNPSLKKQFILVCVNDPNIRIPEKIRQLNKVPVLVVPGFNTPIYGPDAVSWLKNNNFQEKANGLDYGSLNQDDSKYSYISDEMKTSDYNQFFNSDYNHGFTDKESVLNQQFSNLKTDSHITTYDDSSEMKKDISSQLEQRLSEIRNQRDKDVPRPMKRIGGLDNMPPQQNQAYSYGNGGGSIGGSTAPTYNPNPFASHVAPQQPQQMQNRQLPFSMPQMGGGSAGGPRGPALPFNMPMPIQGNQMNRGPTLPFNMPRTGPNLQL